MSGLGLIFLWIFNMNMHIWIHIQLKPTPQPVVSFHRHKFLPIFTLLLLGFSPCFTAVEQLSSTMKWPAPRISRKGLAMFYIYIYVGVILHRL
jgi:hypothetical protein